MASLPALPGLLDWPDCMPACMPTWPACLLDLPSPTCPDCLNCLPYKPALSCTACLANLPYLSCRPALPCTNLTAWRAYSAQPFPAWPS